jgi:hypothetical protein
MQYDLDLKICLSNHRTKHFNSILPMKYLLTGLLIGILSLSAHAGRPLTVDDANVNDKGVAHVESFWSRAADGSRTFSFAPTYSPWSGIDLIAIDTRTLSAGPHSQTLQAKWQVTAARDEGCYFAWVFGATVWQKGNGQKSFVGANGSCNIAGGAFHSSLVNTRDSEGRDTPSLGIAWEHSFGEWSGHIESVAQRSGKPLVGLGLRRDILPGLQLDGTWGKQGGKAVFSLGTKYTF